MNINSIRLGNIDGFEFVCLKGFESGLPYDIYLLSDMNNKAWYREPHLYVAVNEMAVPVLISDNPEVLSSSTIGEIEAVKLWIQKNADNLIEHWNGNISDREVLNRVTE